MRSVSRRFPGEAICARIFNTKPGEEGWRKAWMRIREEGVKGRESWE